MEWLFGVVGFALVGVAVGPVRVLSAAWRVSAAVWWFSALVWAVLKVDAVALAVPVMVGLLVGGLLAGVGAAVAWLARGIDAVARGAGDK